MKLWPFCEIFYARQPVEQLCLQLQNHYQVNIVLVLFLSWHAAHNRRISVAHFTTAKGIASGDLHRIVSSLRQARWAIKSHHGLAHKAVTDHVLAAEILLEKTLLEQLESSIDSQGHAGEHSDMSVQNYLNECGVLASQDNATFLYEHAMACLDP